MGKRITFEYFKNRAKGVHGDKYSYHEETFKGSHKKTVITCPIHGDFKQLAKNHMNGQGCPVCGFDHAKKAHKREYRLFLEKAKTLYDDKFEFPYIEKEYENNKTKITIRCAKCGYEFTKRPNDFLNKNELTKCKQCTSKIKKAKKVSPQKERKTRGISITAEMFTERFKKKFGDEIIPYIDEYVDTQKEMHFECRKCGHVFMRTPNNCLKSKGCPKCHDIKNKKLTTEEFIEKARKIHGDKYDYSESEYKHTDEYVTVICHAKDRFGDEHGRFKVTPHAHIGSMHSGCPKCSGKYRKNTTYFIKEAKFIHGDKYDYSKANYAGAFKKLEIICPKHGSFWMTPNEHLLGKGCKACRYDTVSEKLSMSNDEFIEKANKIHNGRYDYSKVKYVDSSTKVCIICPNHGEFWQSPSGHLRGHNCPICKQSHLENEITQLLKENNIHYEPQKKFDWLGRKSLDFYIPEYNIAIECQGSQHFQSSDFFGGENGFLKVKKSDSDKKALCEENGVELLYYSNLGIEYPYKVYEDKNELLKEIIKKE